jgi:hypothetical protein
LSAWRTLHFSFQKLGIFQNSGFVIKIILPLSSCISTVYHLVKRSEFEHMTFFVSTKQGSSDPTKAMEGNEKRRKGSESTWT